MFLLTLLPSNFIYLYFAVIIFIIGAGGGMFAAPNTAAIMSSVPPEARGAASGMRATLQNVGSTISLAIFFTIVVLSLASSLPAQLSSAISSAGAPQLANSLTSIPPTTALFAAFLGYNPMKTLISQLPANQTSELSSNTIASLESNTWFPNAISKSFLNALAAAFYIGVALSVIGAAASLLRGKKYINESSRISDEERVRKLEKELDAKKKNNK